MKALLGGGKSRVLRRSKIKESKTPAVATVDSVEVVDVNDDGSVLSSSSEVPRPRYQGTDQPESTIISELKSKLEESESMLATRNEDVQKLNNLNTKMKTELEDIMLGESASNFGNAKRISELEAQLALNKSQKVEAIRSEMNDQIDSLKHQALEKENQCSELTAKLAATTKEISNLEELSNKHSEESDNLKNALEEQKGLNTDLGKKLIAKDEAILLARKDFEWKLARVEESLKTKQDAAIVNITKSHTKKIGSLKEQLAKKESELEGVNTSRSIQADNDSNQEKKLKELQSQLTKAEAANKKMQLKTNAATEAARGSKVALDRVSAEHKTELERVNKTHIIQVSELRKAIQLMEAEKNEIAANFSKVSQKEGHANRIHSEQVSELRKAIQLVETEKAEITANFAKETEAEQQKRTKKIAKIKELKDALNESKRALEIAAAQEKTSNEEHANKMEKLQKDSDTQIAKLKSDFSKQSQALNTELVAKGKTMDKLRISGEKTEMEVERQAQTHKAELDQLNKSIENAKKAQSDMLAKNKEERKNLKNKVNDSMRALDLATTQQKTSDEEHANKIEKLQKDNDDQIAKLKSDFSKQSQALNTELVAKGKTMDKLRISGEKTEMEVERQAQTHKAELDQLNKVHTMKVVDLEKLLQKHAKESAELSSRIENEKKAQSGMLAKNKEEMKKLKNSVNDSKRALDVATTQQKTSNEEHADKMKTLQKDNDDQIAKLKSDFSKQNQALNTELVAKEKTMEKLRISGEKAEMEVERQAQAHKAELDQLKKVHTMKVVDLEKLLQKHAKESAELSSRIENEKKAQSDMLVKNKEAMKKLQNSVNDSKRALDVATTQQKTIKEEHANTMKKLQKDNDAQIAKLKSDFSKQNQLLNAEIIAHEKTVEKIRLERDSATATSEKTQNEIERQALDHEAKVATLEKLANERETDSIKAESMFMKQKETLMQRSAQAEKEIQKLKENLISAQQSLDMVVAEKSLLQKEQVDRIQSAKKLSATQAKETDALRQEIRQKDEIIEKLKKDNSIRAKKAASDAEDQKHALVHEHTVKLQNTQKTHDALTSELNASHSSEIKALKIDLSTKSKQTRKINADQDETIGALTANKIELHKELAGLKTKMANATKSYEDRIADLETHLKKDETLLLKVRSELDTEKTDKQKKLNTEIGKRTELQAQICELQSRIKKADCNTADLHAKLAKEREDLKEWKMEASSMQQEEAKAEMTRDLPSIVDPAMQRKQKNIWRKLLFTLVFLGSFIWIGAQFSTNEKLQNDLQILLKRGDMSKIGSIVEEMIATKGRISYAPEAFLLKDGSPFHRFKLVALDELNRIKNRFEKATNKFTSRDRADTETKHQLAKDKMLSDESITLAAKEQAAQRKVAEMLAEREALQQEIAAMRAVQESSKEQCDSFGLEQEELNKQLQDQVATVTSELEKDRMLSDESVTLAAKEQAAQRKVAEMLAERESLHQEIAAMRTVQVSCKEQSDSLGLEQEELNKQLQDQVTTVTSERDTLQHQISFIQERIGSLSEAQSALQKTINNILEKSVKMLDT